MKKRGFTIVELLIYMGLLTIFIVVLTQIFLSTLDVQLSSEATSAVSRTGRFILSRLSYDVSRAQTITIPLALGGSADALQLTINSVVYTYSVTNGTLNLANDKGTDAVNSVDATISGFTVQRLGNTGGKESVQIGFTVTAVTKTLPVESRSFQTTIGIR